MFKQKDILNWMDNQIKAYKLADTSLYDVSEDIKISNISLFDKKVHVCSDGMLEIMKMPCMAKKVRVEDRDDEDYPYQVEIVYKGFKFFALMTDEEYRPYKS